MNRLLRFYFSPESNPTSGEPQPRPKTVSQMETTNGNETLKNETIKPKKSKK